MTILCINQNFHYHKLLPLLHIAQRVIRCSFMFAVCMFVRSGDGHFDHLDKLSHWLKWCTMQQAHSQNSQGPNLYLIFLSHSQSQSQSQCFMQCLSRSFGQFQRINIANIIMTVTMAMTVTKNKIHAPSFNQMAKYVQVYLNQGFFKFLSK